MNQNGLTHKLTVDIGVDEVVQLINLRLQIRWVVVQGRLLLGEELVECSVKYTDDLRALVVDDCVQFFIPEDRDCEPT